MREGVYIKVCIIIRQLLFLRPKKRDSTDLKSLLGDAALLKPLRYWGVVIEPSNVLLQMKDTN